jgi:hypothetical protein
MYSTRKIESSLNWQDTDGTKIYTISAKNSTVEQSKYHDRLQKVKENYSFSWDTIPSFAIFHEGIQYPYLILAWWSNDNELFNSVSVLTEQGWQENHQLYSFCIFDLEVIWAERNIFIETVYCDNPNILEYHKRRYSAK